MNDIAIPPSILTPYQWRWITDKAALKIGDKARRIGITWATALEGSVTCALLPSEGGTDVWYTVNHEDDAREFVDDAADWTRGCNIAASEIGEVMVEDEENDILAFRIRYASGNKLTALSSRARRLRGKSGYAIYDEAAHGENVGEFLKAAKAFTMWGGRLALISTHNGTDSEFNKTIEQIRAGILAGSLHRTTIDDALADGLFKRICLRNGAVWSRALQEKWRADLFALYGEDADEELLCTPRGAGGRYMTRTIIEQCTEPDIPILRLNLEDAFTSTSYAGKIVRMQRWIKDNVDPVLERVPTWANVYFGEDYGRVSDLTVLCPMYLDQAMTRIVPFMIELRNVPFEQQRMVIFHVLEFFAKRKRLAGGLFDGTGNGETMAELAATTFGASAIRMTKIAGGAPRSEEERTDKKTGKPKPGLKYSEALPPLKARFEDRGIVIPRDRDVTQDLEMFERQNGLPTLPPTKLRGSNREYRHGDAGVAIMLAHYATLEMIGRPFSVSTSTRERRVRL